MPQLDTSLLTAALVGYAQQKGEIEAKIAAIKKQLGGHTATPGGGDAPGPFLKPKRRMSAAARKRIAEAQKKRWAAYRKRKAA
jgi:hypothetical protein